MLLHQLMQASLWVMFCAMCERCYQSLFPELACSYLAVLAPPSACQKQCLLSLL